jgi:hypothetical protein
MQASFKGQRRFLTEATKIVAPGGEVSWSGIERRRMVPDPETPAEAVAAYRNPWRRRLGDRIAKTCVVQKERVPALA